MISLTQCHGKAYAVIGLGKAGKATLEALKAAGATVYVWDDSDQAREQCAEAVSHLNDIPWKSLQAVILSPGVPFTHPTPHPAVTAAQVAGVPITSDIDLLYTHAPEATYLGITGTNGKSTTTALMQHLLQSNGRTSAIGGNFGVPVLQLPAFGKEGTYVLELSSYQLDLAEDLHCHGATWLNLSPDHLDRHGDMTGYARAKQRIFRHMTPHDIAVVGQQDAPTAEAGRQLKTQPDAPRVFALQEGTGPGQPLSATYQTGECWLTDAEGQTRHFAFHANDALRGLHNAQNAAAAAALAAFACDLSGEAIQQGLSSFGGLAHRMEKVAEYRGLRFVNDSKATNVDAAIRALGSYEHIYWLAGGKAKDDDLNLLNPLLPRVRKSYLFGSSRQRFADWLTAQGQPFALFETLAEAFQAAARDAISATPATVLLSPACASFDQWPNFEVRGDSFRSLAEAFIRQEAA